MLNVPLAWPLEKDQHKKWVARLLPGIIVLAFILRLLFFNGNPPALNQDEAMTGYNAYSLLRTLRDHRGFFLPAQMHGFGNIGLVSPLYTYLTVPFVALFGLNETAVRLPALVINVLLILVVYKLCLVFFENEIMALLAALLLSLNPWHFHFSRISHEAVLSPFFYCLIILLFYLAFTRQRYLRYFIGGGVTLGLSLYVYQVAFLLSPLLLVIMSLFYLKQLLLRRFAFLLGLALSLIIAFPAAWTLFFHPEKDAESRFADVAIFRQKNYPALLIEQYASHFSNDFLYFHGETGDMPYGDNSYGVLNLYMSVLLPLGGVFLGAHFLAQKKYRRRILLVFLFILLYPLPAALTRPCPHLLRAYTLLPFFHIMAAAGLWLLLRSIRELSFRRCNAKVAGVIRGWLFGLCTVPVLIIFGIFLVKYYFIFPKNPLNFDYYQYGIKEAITFVQAHDKQIDKVYFTARFNQPFIFFLFYTRYDPVAYRIADKVAGMAYFGYVSQFDKYYFKEENDMPLAERRALFIVNERETMPGLDLLYTVRNPAGKAAFRIWGKPELLPGEPLQNEQ